MDGKFTEVLAWVRFGLNVASKGFSTFCDCVGDLNDTKDQIGRIRSLDVAKRELPQSTHRSDKA